jgi:DNA-directed RNA polymerase sigma subunit (sigma70/sigma32)|tara:strand:- start:4037 stop:4240 length:204 start_codon:yes stop_codon:yes gene_type:complete
MQEKSDRNAEIYRMRHVEDMTFTAIGERLGLSRERVRQVFERMKSQNEENWFAKGDYTRGSCPNCDD